MENEVMKNKEESRSGQKYAELLCDFMFKRLFGSEANKDVLIGFLNMLLKDVEIIDVEFIPTEHLGLTEEDRKVIFDISCRCKDGRSFIIEMQKGYQKHFLKRAVYYTTYPINEQGRLAHELYLKEKANNRTHKKFAWDYDLKPVTVVAILNFRFDHSDDWPTDRFISSYRLREDSIHEKMTDALRFVFLELGRFNKKIWELETVADKWIYLLKHMHEMEEIPKKFSDPLFTRLFLLAKIGSFTAEELRMYKQSHENMGDYENIINTAREEAEKLGWAIGHAKGHAEGHEKGREEGRAEGRAEGREEGREEGRAEGITEGMSRSQTEIARKMVAAGIQTEQIMEFTGLDKDTVEKLTSDR